MSGNKVGSDARKSRFGKARETFADFAWAGGVALQDLQVESSRLASATLILSHLNLPQPKFHTDRYAYKNP